MEISDIEHNFLERIKEDKTDGGKIRENNLFENGIDYQYKGIKDFRITLPDFFIALNTIVPSLKREGFNAIPETTWSEIGGLDELREEMRRSVVTPILFPDLYRKFGVDKAQGVLLFGPPGCGKTLVAKATANEAKTAFISVKGPELLNSLVGETEKAIRALFSRAKACSPCVIFIDEIDSLVPRRSSQESSGEVSHRVVTQLLSEMSGVDDRDGVFVIAATNRPDLIDRALLRPGRLGKIIYVALPDEKSRHQILEKHLLKIPCKNRELVLNHLQTKCEGFSGADCAFLVQTAAVESLSEHNQFNEIDVNLRHFETALRKVKRSVSKGCENFNEKNAKNF